mmetsp:Transcript_19597/g.47022  ORF Transcript_19597/g.47022 Transcript_19597/m.47022 type:complete len:204 (-) Transcript_19597:967-1578(-)
MVDPMAVGLLSWEKGSSRTRSLDEDFRTDDAPVSSSVLRDPSNLEHKSLIEMVSDDLEGAIPISFSSNAASRMSTSGIDDGGGSTSFLESFSDRPPRPWFFHAGLPVPSVPLDGTPLLDSPADQEARASRFGRPRSNGKLPPPDAAAAAVESDDSNLDLNSPMPPAAASEGVCLAEIEEAFPPRDPPPKRGVRGCIPLFLGVR